MLVKARSALGGMAKYIKGTITHAGKRQLEKPVDINKPKIVSVETESPPPMPPHDTLKKTTCELEIVKPEKVDKTEALAATIQVYSFGYEVYKGKALRILRESSNYKIDYKTIFCGENLFQLSEFKGRYADEIFMRLFEGYASQKFSYEISTKDQRVSVLSKALEDYGILSRTDFPIVDAAISSKVNFDFNALAAMSRWVESGSREYTQEYLADCLAR